MRKYMLTTILMLVLFSSPLSGYSQDIRVYVDNVNIPFNQSTGYPFVDSNSRTLVPFRVVLEKFGCAVSWNQSNQAAVASKNGITVQVPIGQNFIRINGTVKANDSAAQIVDGRTYLPIRAVLEAFEAQVSWDQQKQAVVVASSSSAATSPSDSIPAIPSGDLSKMVSVKVKSVIDGDTFRTNSGDLVRLIGIDAPEKDGPYTTNEYYSKEATEFVTSLISGKTVYLQKDVSDVDKHDRLLRYVYLEDGRLLNLLLVEGGYAEAVSYLPDTKHAGVLNAAEESARKAKLGLWGAN